MNKKGFKLTKKKGIILLTLFTTVILGVIGYGIFSTKNKSIDIKNDKFAIYTMDPGSDTYTLSSQYSTISSLIDNGYRFKTTESTCTNGATLTYDSSTKTVGLTTTSATQCNLYFDCFPVSSMTGTIKAYTAGTYNNGNGTPVGTYMTITGAAAAAGEGGTVALSSGMFYFSESQYINVDGITITGAGIDSTEIITSDYFSKADTEERYSLITTTGSNITIKNLTVDGGSYGAYLAPTSSAETFFSVIRAVSGSLNLDSIRIGNSKRNLLVIGDELYTNGGSSALVTTNNVVFEGSDKPVDLVNTYYDVKISYGSLTLDANSVIDCVIGLDPNSSSSIKQLNIGNRDDLYTFGVPSTFWTYPFYTSATSTSKYFLYLYSACTTDPFKSTFVKLYDYSQNQDAIDDMVWSTIDSLEDGATSDELMTANQLLNLIAYLHFVAYPDNTTIEDMYDELNNAIASAEY